MNGSPLTVSTPSTLMLCGFCSLIPLAVNGRKPFRGLITRQKREHYTTVTPLWLEVGRRGMDAAESAVSQGWLFARPAGAISLKIA